VDPTLNGNTKDLGDLCRTSRPIHGREANGCNAKA
jgi:hypothetical protein